VKQICQLSVSNH